MKNLVIVIVSFLSVIFGILWLNASNERDHAIAQLRMDQAQSQLKTEFVSLSEQWGDRADVDTLISEGQWQVIKSGDMTPDQMIAYAETVKNAYDTNGWGDYTNVINTENFQRAADDYAECKKRLENS